MRVRNHPILTPRRVSVHKRDHSRVPQRSPRHTENPLQTRLHYHHDRSQLRIHYRETNLKLNRTKTSVHDLSARLKPSSPRSSQRGISTITSENAHNYRVHARQENTGRRIEEVARAKYYSQPD